MQSSHAPRATYFASAWHILFDQLIRSLRLQRAADLLAKKSGTVAEICYAVGFGEQANFSRAFKKQFGCSPSEYQKTHQKKLTT